VHAIWAVGRSAVIFSLAVATRVLAYFAASPPGGAPPQAFPTLTDREILYLIARGHPNPSIARGISRRLLSAHRRSMPRTWTIKVFSVSSTSAPACSSQRPCSFRRWPRFSFDRSSRRPKTTSRLISPTPP
jgi:hypothetical protein